MVVNGRALDRLRRLWGQAGGELPLLRPDREGRLPMVGREAVNGNPAYSDTMYGSGYEDRAFRSLRVGDPFRDLVGGTFNQLLKECWDAYTNNPLAYAIIEMGTDFVVGSGVHARAKDPRVQRLIDAFWNDPENNLEERCPLLYTELSLHGELFLRFYTDAVSGRTVVRSVDPLRVVDIETDLEDVERPLVYRIATTQEGGGVVSVPASEMQHYKLNVLPYVKRGRSDLTATLPWLRRYKDWLTDRVRINKYKAAFLYDVTIDGATPEDLARKRAEYGAPPEPGTVLFHNQAEHWNVVVPRIGGEEVASDGRSMRLMIATAARVPEHFLSEGGETNRATASEMGLPTFRHYRRRQELMRMIVRRMVVQGIEGRVGVVGGLGPRVLARGLGGIDVAFDEIQEIDRRAAGQMATMFANALSLAQQQGWMTRMAARELFIRFLGEEMGEVAKLDDAEELKLVRAMGEPAAAAAAGARAR